MLDCTRLNKVILNNNKMATVKEVDTAMKADMNYWGVQSNSVQAIRRSYLQK